MPSTGKLSRLKSPTFLLCPWKASTLISCVATIKTTVGAMVMEAVITEALAVAMRVTLAMALALATTIENSVEESPPLHLDIKIHQF